MNIRALDLTGDWTFGSGPNNYKTGNAAVAQDIQCRLSSFLNDCFFNTNAGLDWFNLLGSKNELALNLAVAATLLNTGNVTGILQLSITVDSKRNVSIQYNVQTTFSVLSGTFQYDLGA